MRVRVTGSFAHPREDVFAYIADPLRLPAWNSAVRSVTAVARAQAAVGARYRMHRALPSGPADNELEIVTMARPAVFTLRTLSGPTPFVYRYRLSDTDAGGTLLELDADVELTGAGILPSPLATLLVRRGIEANFRLLESRLRRR